MNVNSKLEHVLDIASSDVMERGKTWYDKAANECKALARYHSLPFENVAGIVAALSPGCNWEINILFADFIIEHPFDAFDYAKHDSRFFTYCNDNIVKALDILEGFEPEDVLTGLKVVPFYQSIVRPDYGLPVIDSHMFRFFDIFPRLYLRVKERENIIKSFIHVAHDNNLQVRQLQAIAWLWQKENK